MNVSMEIKKQEAIKRMKALKLFGPCITAFKNRNEVQLTEPNGGLYEFSDDAELNAKIKAFEAENNALVYHVIHSPCKIDGYYMDMYNLLYVSDYQEEWEMDNEDINYNYVLCYVWNKTDEWCSEFGTIGVRQLFGGLVRAS